MTTPYPGVTHTIYTDETVPLRLHLVAVDITSQEIHLYARQSAERGQTVSQFARCSTGTSGCVTSNVAINGDLFEPLGYVPMGLAMGEAKQWPDTTDTALEGFFAFGRPMDLNQAAITAPADGMPPPSTTEGVVGGRALLVHAGEVQTSYDANDPTEPFRLAPRTAVGLDATGHTLYLVVVDGDQPSSLGMTAEELARFMAQSGASDALELDGGGASTLYIAGEGGLVSSPSDGVERTVANQLGVRYGALPYRASVVGKVFDSIFNGTVITNATVTVDDVLASWQNNHTLYSVDNITPHYVCARASAPGFKTGTQCRQITTADIIASQIQYLSLVLYPGTDPPPDMSAPPDLSRPDFSSVNDSGAPARWYDLATPAPTVDSGGCAYAVRRPLGTPRDSALGAGAILAVVVCIGGAAVWRRRRKRLT